MKKAVISILIAIVLGVVMLIALSTKVDVDYGIYENFGVDCEYYILSEHIYGFAGKESSGLLRYVYSYSVHDNHIFLYGSAKWVDKSIYMVVDYKNKSVNEYNKIDDAPVVYRKYLAKLPTYPTLPETLLTRWLRKHVI
jgi:hypothetical protein